MQVRTVVVALMALLIGLATLQPAEASGLREVHQKGEGYASFIVSHPTRQHARQRATHGAYARATYVPQTGNVVTDAIATAAARWGVSYDWLLRVATCESGLNPGAYNPSGASGLFQFMPSTYWYFAGRIGETRSYWDPYGASNVAAYMFSIGQSYQWTCR